MVKTVQQHPSPCVSNGKETAPRAKGQRVHVVKGRPAGKKAKKELRILLVVRAQHGKQGGI
jgi:hypothetical protein